MGLSAAVFFHFKALMQTHPLAVEVVSQFVLQVLYVQFSTSFIQFFLSKCVLCILLISEVEPVA
jgi:hypothetical protein